MYVYAQFAENKLGKIDVLVLNHAVFQADKWDGTHENITNLQLSMDVNFFAFVTAATHALPALEKSRGSIIVMNSLYGRPS